MAKILRAIRGMHDLLPEQMGRWHWVEDSARRLLESYGYEEIRTPLLEPTALFQRSIGEVTDIVEKEMYSFQDRNGELLSLRPEGTASCVRAAIEHNLLDRPQRLWYRGPMFRRERPQKGRYRQFHQIGAEVFGLAGPDIDQELILLTHRLWKILGLSGLRLEINSLGDAEDRHRYREALVQYLETRRELLDEDSRRRLATNPLRILDSKNPDVQALIAEAPSMLDFLGKTAQEHFAQLCDGLRAADIPFQINPRLVRGLDYYNRTVFEWITDKLGAQGTLCAGGRYDGLVEQLGGRSVPAVGFALGLERLVALLESLPAQAVPALDAYLVAVGERAQAAALVLAEQLRDQSPDLRLCCHCGGGSFKSQFKKADRSGARYALILGEEELERGVMGIKPLRDQGPQIEKPLASVVDFLLAARTADPTE